MSNFPFRAAIIPLLLVAFALRIHKIDRSSMWVDEGASISVAHYPIRQILESRIFIQDSSYPDSHPPLYYLTLAGGRRLLGDSDFSYRFGSAIASLLVLPVIYQLGKTLHSRRAGLLAICFGAVNSTWIEYAQEARMYALVLLLTGLVVYGCLKLIGKNQEDSKGKALLLFGVSSLLLAFSDYPIFSLLGVLALFILWWGWRLGYRKLIVIGLASAVVLLSATWAVLRPGLPYFEASQLSPPQLARFAWRLVENTVNLSTFSSSAGLPLALRPVLDRLIYPLLAIGLFSIRHAWQRLIGLALWLALPLGLLIFAIISPGFEQIFHLRHVLASSLAVVLFVSIGIVALVQSKRWPGKILGVALCALILLTSVSGTIAYYPQNGSQKDDYRALVHTIMTQAGDQDIVLFHNAARLPLYEHYHFRADLPVMALPFFPNPADENTLDLLEKIAERYERIWFVVGKPIGGLDDEKLIHQWLDEHAEPFASWSFYSHSTAVELIGYDVGHLQGAGNWPTCFDRFEPLSHWQDVTVPTFWFRTPQSPGAHTVKLLDAHDTSWASVTLDDPLGCQQKSIQLPFGLPSGRYRLVETGADSHITWLDIAPSTAWNPDFSPAVSQPTPVRFGENVQLHGLIEPASEFWPGTHFTGRVMWSNTADRPLAVPVVGQLRLLNRAGDLIREKSQPLNPNESWPAGAIVTTPLELYAQPDWPPGRYQLEWRLEIDGQLKNGKSGWLGNSAEWVPAGEIIIDEWPLKRTVPNNPDIIEVDAKFGDSIELHGYKIEPVDRSGQHQIDLIWRASGQPEHDYVVFIHLFDPATSDLVGQQDRIPVDWWRPTSGWRTGEIIIDSYRFDLNLQELSLFVGLYRADTQERLPIVFKGQPQPNNQLQLR